MTAKAPDPMPAVPRCADCSVAMEEGFIPDATLGGMCQSSWHRGLPETVEVLGMPGGLKIVGVKCMPIRAFRCPKCGLLRSYAFPRVWRKA